MTSIGLLDTFGKLNIQIHIGDEIKALEFISPVPKQEIINWLQKDNLIDKATLIQFQLQTLLVQTGGSQNMKTWKRGRKKATPEQQQIAKEWQKERVRITNLVTRDDTIDRKCCICGKEDSAILHNKENPYLITFLCRECRKNKENIQKAEKYRFDIRERLDKSKLSTSNFTKQEVANIVKGYTNTQSLTIGEYCEKLNITRHQFNKLLELYAKYFPEDKTTLSAIVQKRKAIQRKRLIREAEERTIVRLNYNASNKLYSRK